MTSTTPHRRVVKSAESKTATASASASAGASNSNKKGFFDFIFNRDSVARGPDVSAFLPPMPDAAEWYPAEWLDAQPLPWKWTESQWQEPCAGMLFKCDHRWQMTLAMCI
jgi:hypothetical protein